MTDAEKEIQYQKETSYSDGFIDGFSAGLKQGRQDVIDEHSETFEWCHDCKEYDQLKHCCHRWTKEIRRTRDDLYHGGREDALVEVEDKFKTAIKKSTFDSETKDWLFWIIDEIIRGIEDGN